VVARLNGIQSGVRENPESLSSLKTELPVLLTTLQKIHNTIKDAGMPPKSATTLHPTIESCKNSTEEIDATLSKILPSRGDGKTKALLKSVGSVWGERKIEGITASLRGCIATLTLYFAVSSSMLQSSTGKNIRRRLWSTLANDLCR
jgi:hypothetical protein